ncbi:DnaD family protein [Mesoplasma chauliocola]|uniref:DnaD family protein n=1 Tax=Mesoplasma chauliocola TaxID=216427 RepID=A0A249SMW9_9MOLU|nr:DnaD family protein [Mesoplasma chauliocola]ASZ08960.1 DnaD family protein [Mesoplasma chauliocola]
MLVELLAKGLISKHKLLLENYKKIGMNENQVMLVLITMQLSDENKKMITPLKLSKFMNISIDTIEIELQDLVDKRLVKIKPKEIDFSLLFLKIVLLIENESVKKGESYFIQTIEKELGWKFTLPQIEEVKDLLHNAISRQQVLDILYKNEIKNYESFLKIVGRYSNKIEKSLKFNWLEN